jgi:hypothetical protein
MNKLVLICEINQFELTTYSISIKKPTAECTLYIHEEVSIVHPKFYPLNLHAIRRPENARRKTYATQHYQDADVHKDAQECQYSTMSMNVTTL